MWLGKSISKLVKDLPSTSTFFLIVAAFALVFFMVVRFIKRRKRKKQLEQIRHMQRIQRLQEIREHESWLQQFIAQMKELTPQEFFSVKSMQQGDVVGVYVIHNQTKDKYYVGQAKRLFFRVNQHFTGHGNAYVFADYHYGDAFTIQILPLANSGYSDLDALEKEMIRYFNAYPNGYNRNRGNGGRN